MTVFVVQEPLHRNPNTGMIEPRMTLKAAEGFGKLAYLASWRALEILGALNTVIEDIEDKLVDFNDQDYILPVGSPILIGIVSAIAASNNSGRMKMLYWDRHERCYSVLAVCLDDFTPPQKGQINDNQTNRHTGGEAEEASTGSRQP